MFYDSVPRTCYPHSKIEDDSYDWWARHELKVRQAREKSHDLVFIGDSITHFWQDEGDSVSSRLSGPVWQEFYGRRNAFNLGYGYDRPQNTLWHLEYGEFDRQRPALIVLNIGSNSFCVTPRYPGDSPDDAFAGVRTVIEKLFELSPESRMILMGIFPRSGVQEKVDALNARLERYAAGETRIDFVSLRDRFLRGGEFVEELYRDRFCHPSPAGYRVWAEAIEPLVSRRLKEQGLPG